MKAYISATSGEENYPTICEMHEFESLDKAVDFARYGAKGFKENVGDQLVLEMKKPFFGHFSGADVIIERDLEFPFRRKK